MNNSIRTVVITGTYSSFNKGDAAMQTATAQRIRALWPNSDIIISSPFKKADQGKYPSFKVIQSSRRNLIKGTIQVIRAFLFRYLGRRPSMERWLLGNAELSFFQKADLIVDLSGDTLTEDYGPHVTYSHFLPIWLGLAFERPVFICAQSIGPFKLTKPISRYTLNKVSKITAREAITKDYLLGIGVKSSLVEVTADMAFLLEPAPTDKVNAILRLEGVKEAEAPVLGVTISNLVIDRFARHSGYDLIETIANVLDRLVDKYGFTVYLLAHVTGPSESKNDRLISRKIKHQMNHNQQVIVFEGDYDPGELKGVIARCSVLLGSRMHSNIAALSSAVPTVAIGYSHKTNGIMSLFSMEEYSVNIDSTDGNEIYNLVASAFTSRVGVSEQLRKAIRSIKEKSTRNLDIIQTLGDR